MLLLLQTTVADKYDFAVVLKHHFDDVIDRVGDLMPGRFDGIIHQDSIIILPETGRDPIFFSTTKTLPRASAAARHTSATPAA